MKPSIHKVKSIRGHIVGYTASIGPITSAQKGTPTDARQQAQLDANAALIRLDRGTRVFRWREHTIVVSPTIAGWNYWIDTFDRTDYTVSGNYVDREDAENAALHHLAQNLWTDSADDSAFVQGLPQAVQREVRSWITFQRGYAVAKASGMTDVDAHRAGCEAKSAGES